MNLEKFLGFLSDATKSHDFGVFIDLSRFIKVDSSRRNEFMLVLRLLACTKCRMLVSVSTGAQHMSTTKQTLSYQLDNILRVLFTYEEAESYWTNSKPFTGLNPYLMSLVAKHKSRSSASGKIASFIHNYLDDNLDLDKNCATIAQYLKRAEIYEGAKFALYANCQRELSDGDIELYEETWLYKYHFTVKEVQSNILRWNFPTLGPVYHDILPNFISNSTNEQVKEVCIKEPSFAGFWLERLFIEHHKKSEAPIN